MRRWGESADSEPRRLDRGEPVDAKTMKRPIKRFLMAACLLIAVVAAGRYVLGRVNRSVRNGYAMDIAASYVVEYMRQNDNAWPRQWADLETIAKSPLGDGASEELATLQSMVVIDWSMDPRTLAAFVDKPARERPVVVHLIEGQPDARSSRADDIVYRYIAAHASPSLQPK